MSRTSLLAGLLLVGALLASASDSDVAWRPLDVAEVRDTTGGEECWWPGLGSCAFTWSTCELNGTCDEEQWCTMPDGSEGQAAYQLGPPSYAKAYDNSSYPGGRESKRDVGGPMHCGVMWYCSSDCEEQTMIWKCVKHAPNFDALIGEYQEDEPDPTSDYCSPIAMRSTRSRGELLAMSNANGLAVDPFHRLGN
jgi:hypothetical protein